MTTRLELLLNPTDATRLATLRDELELPSLEAAMRLALRCAYVAHQRGDIVRRAPITIELEDISGRSR